MPKPLIPLLTALISVLNVWESEKAGLMAASRKMKMMAFLHKFFTDMTQTPTLMIA